MRIRSLEIVIAAFILTVTASPALAMYHASKGRFMQRDPHGTAIAATGRSGGYRLSKGRGFVPRDQYPDGMNLYAAYHVVYGAVDPSGMSIHAVPTPGDEGGGSRITREPATSFRTDFDPAKSSCCGSVMYNPRTHCCIDEVLVETARDDFGRRCCPGKMQEVVHWTEPQNLQAPIFGGHEWIEYPHPDTGKSEEWGFYPDPTVPTNAFLLLFWNNPGEIQNDSNRVKGAPAKRYNACPESVQALHDAVEFHKSSPEMYCGWYYNCQHWVSDVLDEASDWAPYPGLP